MTSASPSTKMLWNATATVRQFEQLATAHASFTWSTGPSVTHTTAKATSYTDEPAPVLTASAWLSPSPGGAGGSKGKGHSPSVVSSGASPGGGSRMMRLGPGSVTGMSCGDSTSASRGCREPGELVRSWAKGVSASIGCAERPE